jgi:hypothetical protein
MSDTCIVECINILSFKSIKNKNSVLEFSVFLLLIDYMAEFIMKCIHSRVTTGNMTVHLQVTYALYIGFDDVSFHYVQFNQFCGVVC